MVANPAKKMPARVKLLIVLNNFDFNFLYNILFSPYLICLVGLAPAEPSAIVVSG